VFGIKWRKIHDIVYAFWRYIVKKEVGGLAVRINEGNTLSALQILNGKILQ